MRKALVLVAVALVLTGCSGNWGWYVVNPTTPNGYTNVRFLLSGLQYTILLSATAISISILAGLLVALPGLSSRPALRWASRIYVEIVR
ncbi:MAG: amino acid ABC transporter permease, partial [Hoeflea sp.]|nr:amino acid ABC transporter permease [Hoeflea sp.]